MLMHDWSDEGLRGWAEKDYAAALRDPTVHFRLVGQHFHTKWDGAPTGNAAFHPSSCDLMLIGHGHVVANIQTNPYCIYEDGPAFRYGSSGFFNFRRTPKGWNCDQTTSTRNLTNDAWNLFTDHGAVKKVRADQPDTMNISTNVVTIENDLPQNFFDGRVRFVLDRGKQWIARNGAIMASYDCDDGRRTAVLVRVNIQAVNSVTVSLLPAAETTLPRN